MDKQPKVIIITGGGGGIGRATVTCLVKNGHKVTAVDISSNSLISLEKECSGLPGKVITLQADARKRSDVEKVISNTIEAFGGIDVMINNVGVERVNPIDKISDDDYEQTIDVNLRSVYLFSQSVLPYMKQQKSGLIINFSSTAGLRGIKEDSVYCASKFGVIGFSEAMDEEVRQYGIKVSVICPGNTNTNLPLSWSPMDDPYRKHFLKPEDVAEAVYYIVSQPHHVAIGQLVIRPIIQPPYSSMLPLSKD